MSPLTTYRLTAWYCFCCTFCKWLDSHPTAVAGGSPPNNARRDAARSAAMASDQCHVRWTWWIDGRGWILQGTTSIMERIHNPVGKATEILWDWSSKQQCNQQCCEDPLAMSAAKVQCWQSWHFWPIGQDALLSSQFFVQIQVKWVTQSPLFFASGIHGK